MSTYGKRTALIAILALAACREEAIQDPDATTGGDALTPVRKDMTEAFLGMELRSDPPSKVEDHPELKVTVAQEGEGDTIHYGMIGKFNYIGTLANGSVFKSTYEGPAPEPAVLRLVDGAVPEGLALALDGCKVGERRTVVVPSELAFGDQPDYSQGRQIPANSILTYEIELVELVTDLAIKTLVEGDGDELKYGQRGKFHYTGALADNGKVFDSSLQRGEPTQFPVQVPGVIAGWALGLPGMKVGEKRRLRIPSELAYGAQGQGETIGPNADLVFDVELIEIL